MRQILYIHQDDLSISLEGARKRLSVILRGIYGIMVDEHILSDGKIVFIGLCHYDNLEKGILKTIKSRIGQ